MPILRSRREGRNKTPTAALVDVAGWNQRVNAFGAPFRGRQPQRNRAPFREKVGSNAQDGLAASASRTALASPLATERKKSGKPGGVGELMGGAGGGVSSHSTTCRINNPLQIVPQSIIGGFGPCGSAEN